MRSRHKKCNECQAERRNKRMEYFYTMTEAKLRHISCHATLICFKNLNCGSFKSGSHKVILFSATIRQRMLKPRLIQVETISFTKMKVRVGFFKRSFHFSTSLDATDQATAKSMTQIFELEGITIYGNKAVCLYYIAAWRSNRAIFVASPCRVQREDGW